MNVQAEKRNTASTIYTSKQKTYIIDYPTDSLYRLSKVPFNIAAYGLSQFDPYTYASYAGSLAHQYPQWHNILKSSIPISQTISGAGFLWQFYPAIKTKLNDISQHGFSGIALDAKNHLTCQKRRGTLPVYLQTPWLSQHFYFNVNTPEFNKPTLEINRLNTENKKDWPKENAWARLYSAMELQGFDSLSVKVDTSNKQIVIVNNDKIDELIMKLSIDSDNKTPWILELVNNWCLQIDSKMVHSIFDDETIEAIATKIEDIFSKDKELVISFKPRMINISHNTDRALTIDFKNGNRLAVSDFSDDGHAGYFYLMKNDFIPFEQLTQLLSSRGSEQVIKNSASQQIFNVERALSGSEKMLAQNWVMPEIKKPFSHTDTYKKSHINNKQLSDKENALKLTHVVKSGLIDWLRPLNDVFLRKTAFFMVEPDLPAIYTEHANKPEGIKAEPIVPMDSTSTVSVAKKSISDSIETELMPNSVKTISALDPLTKEEHDLIRYLLTGNDKQLVFDESVVDKVKQMKLKPTLSYKRAVDILEALKDEQNVSANILSEVLVSLEQEKSVDYKNDSKKKIVKLQSELKSGAYFLPVMARKTKEVPAVKPQKSQKRLAKELARASLDESDTPPEKKKKTSAKTSEVKYKQAQSWGRTQRTLVVNHYHELSDNNKLAHDLFKYKGRSYPNANGINVRVDQVDLLKKSHFKPRTLDEKMITNYVIKPNKRDNIESHLKEEIDKKLGTNNAYAQKDIDKANNSLVQMKAYDKAMATTTTEEEVIELIHQYRLSREQIANHHLTSKEVWIALLNYMPAHAVIRNLGIMTSHNVFSRDPQITILQQKLSLESIQRAKLSSVTVLKALNQYHKGHGDKGEIYWTPNEEVVKILEKSYFDSFQNTPSNNKKMCFIFGLSEENRSSFVDQSNVLSLSDAALSVVAPWALKSHCDSTVVLYDEDRGQNFAVEINKQLLTKVTGSLKIVEKLSSHKEEQDKKNLARARESGIKRAGDPNAEVAIQILYLLDLTGSMSDEIDAVKKSIKTSTDVINKILTDIVEHNSNQQIEVAFVGYRDYEKNGRRTHNQIVCVDFTTNIQKVLRVVNKQSADGGADTPEDVAGGFKEVLKCSWLDNSIKKVFHIADAPPHGGGYHNLLDKNDNFIAGDPSGLQPREQMKEMASRGIGYTLLATSKLEVAYNSFKEGFSLGIEQLLHSNNAIVPSMQYKALGKGQVLKSLPTEIENVLSNELKSNKDFLLGIDASDIIENLYGDETDIQNMDAPFVNVPITKFAALAAMDKAIAKETVFDQMVFILATDCQDYSMLHSLNEKIKRYREAVNNKARFIIVSHSKNDAFNARVADLFKGQEHVLLMHQFTEQLPAIDAYWDKVPVDEESLQIGVGAESTELMEVN